MKNSKSNILYQYDPHIGLKESSSIMKWFSNYKFTSLISI